VSSFEQKDETSSFDNVVMEQASAWFLRLRSEQTDAETIGAFHAWLAEDAAHEPAYMQVQALWNGLEDHAATPEVINLRQAALSRARNAQQGGVWRTYGRKVTAAAAIAAMILVGVPAVLYLQPQRDLLVYETALGEARVIALPDNSKISLDAQTRLNVSYMSDKRSIELLEGQAFFDVAKDPSRPFEVIARGQKVLALGTAFNVNMDATRLSVALVEGQVAVSGEKYGAVSMKGGGKTYRLSPGQKLVIEADGSIQFLDKVNLDNVTAWRQGKLIFEDERLADAISQMNRHSHTRISIRDPQISALKVSGVFNAGDTSAFVQALEHYFSVRAERMDASQIGLYARR